MCAHSYGIAVYWRYQLYLTEYTDSFLQENQTPMISIFCVFCGVWCYCLCFHISISCLCYGGSNRAVVHVCGTIKANRNDHNICRRFIILEMFFIHYVLSFEKKKRRTKNHSQLWNMFIFQMTRPYASSLTCLFVCLFITAYLNRRVFGVTWYVVLLNCVCFQNLIFYI